MADEKWFCAMVPRPNAKAVLEGAKVMAYYTAGYCFKYNTGSGGAGFLIGLHRCAAYIAPLGNAHNSSKYPEAG